MHKNKKTGRGQTLLHATVCVHIFSSAVQIKPQKTKTKALISAQMEDGCSQESCECLHLLRSTAQQCPGVGDLVTMGMRQTLLSLLRLCGKGN